MHNNCMGITEIFPGSIHEFYRIKALITLEQVNTNQWSKKGRMVHCMSKTSMVRQTARVLLTFNVCK